ncbi:MAG: DUF1566 domain-containing protein [Proteobacteria bacterium]|nr:DUF1566 domain-containing protein [Pseudomonadota bacterium]
MDGYTDWRLPSKTELSWIAKNEGFSGPYINPIFIGTQSFGSPYWTSTSNALDTTSSGISIMASL